MITERKMSIEEVSRILEQKRIPYGQNITFPQEIDTSSCEWFFGTRCPYNVHVTRENRAHKDRYDPRTNWREHSDYDVSVPHQLVTLGLPTGIGALIGSRLDKEDPERAALKGVGWGLLIRILWEISGK